MTILVKILIIFFASLIIYQIYLLNYTIIEGATFQDYSEDALILSKQNSGNIQVLKERLDSLTGLDAKIEKTNSDLKQIQEQVNVLRDAQVASAMSDIPVITE
jgi:Tfp pilus assembly protein PilN